MARQYANILVVGCVACLLFVTSKLNNGTPEPEYGSEMHRSLLAEDAPAYDGVNLPWDWSWRNWIGITLSIVVSLISGPGGQGGASFYIPLFSVLLHFSVAEAAAITSFIVFLGCISSTAHAMVAPHPINPSKTLIDYTTVLVMMPMLLLGVSFGVLANAVLPSWLLNILLLVVWTWSITKMAYAFKNALIKERRQLAAARAAADTSSHPSDLACDSKASDLEAGQAAGTQEQPSRKHINAWAAEKWQSAKAWAGIQPWVAIITVWAMFAAFVALAVARDVVMQPCSTGYWALLSTQGAVLCAFGLTIAVVLVIQTRKRLAAAEAAEAAAAQPRQASHMIIVIAAAVDGAQGDAALCSGVDQQSRLAAAVTEEKQLDRKEQRAARREARREAAQLRFKLNEDAIVWTVKRLLAMPAVMLLIGLLAGMLGLGGAAFISPMILAWGLHPQVGAGTAKMVLMLSTGGTAISFLAAGRLNIVYALVYGLINVVFTPVGIYLMDKLVKKTGHPSYITLLALIRFILGVLVQLAFSAVPAFIALAQNHPPMLGFNPQGICQ